MSKQKTELFDLRIVGGFVVERIPGGGFFGDSFEYYDVRNGSWVKTTEELPTGGKLITRPRENGVSRRMSIF